MLKTAGLLTGGIARDAQRTQAKTKMMTTEDAEGLTAVFMSAAKQCKRLGLSASEASANRTFQKLFSPDPTSLLTVQRGYEEFHSRLRDEVEARPCFIVPAHTTRYCTESDLFGEDVARRFPEIAEDLEEAGKCLAFGRATACVFHLMRVLEIAVQEFGNKLNVSLADDPTWGAITDCVDKAVGKLPRSNAKEKKFYNDCAEAALLLTYFRRAWRNETMHPKQSYTEEKALAVMRATEDLMVSLVGFL